MRVPSVSLHTRRVIQRRRGQARLSLRLRIRTDRKGARSFSTGQGPDVWNKTERTKRLAPCEKSFCGVRGGFFKNSPAKKTFNIGELAAQTTIRHWRTRLRVRIRAPDQASITIVFMRPGSHKGATPGNDNDNLHAPGFVSRRPP